MPVQVADNGINGTNAYSDLRYTRSNHYSVHKFSTIIRYGTLVALTGGYTVMPYIGKSTGTGSSDHAGGSKIYIGVALRNNGLAIENPAISGTKVMTTNTVMNRVVGYAPYEQVVIQTGGIVWMIMQTTAGGKYDRSEIGLPVKMSAGIVSKEAVSSDETLSGKLKDCILMDISYDGNCAAIMLPAYTKELE